MAVVDETRYKPNSYRSKAEQEKKEVNKVIKGNVKRHEKTTGEKIKESIFGDNVDNVGEYLVLDLLIPSAKELASNFLTNAINIILFGEAAEPVNRRSGRGGYVAYDGYSRRKPRQRDRDGARRARFDFSDIEFDDLDDIDEVVQEMKDIWTVYNEISVAQFYQAVGVEVRPTDYNWGWIDIRAFTTADAHKVRSSDGTIAWVLELPKPKPLDY